MVASERSGQVLRLVLLIVGILVLTRIASCHGPILDASESQKGEQAVVGFTTTVAVTDPVDNQTNPLNSEIRPAPIECALPPTSLDSAAQLQFVTAAVTCLRETWLRALREAHAFKPSLTPSDQEVSVYTVDTVRKSCGDKPTEPTDEPLYCGGKQKILWPSKSREFQHMHGRLLRTDMLFAVMHEYGHHIQFLTGVQAQADRTLAQWGKDSPLGQQISRRVELQAQCLAGVAMAAAVRGGTVDLGDAEDMVDMQGDVLEEPYHGSGTANFRWSLAGYQSGSTAACNTWAAAPADVE